MTQIKSNDNKRGNKSNGNEVKKNPSPVTTSAPASTFAGSMGTRPTDAKIEELEKQADAKRGSIAGKGKRVVPVIVAHETSAKIAELLNERLGAKSADGSPAESTVRLNASANEALGLAGLLFIPENMRSVMDTAKVPYAGIIVGSANGRTIVKFVVGIDALEKIVPVATKKIRASKSAFPFVAESSTLVRIRYENAESVINNVTQIEIFNGSTKAEKRAKKYSLRAYATINGIEYPIYTRRKIEVYPESFDADGKYIATRTRKSTDGSDADSATTPDRVTFICAINTANGIDYVVADGMNNVINRLCAYQHAKIVALADADLNIANSVILSRDIEEKQADNEADDSDADDSNEENEE